MSLYLRLLCGAVNKYQLNYLLSANGREYSELSWQANEGKHYVEFNDGKTSAEDALSKLLQQDVRPPSGSQNNVSFDMKSAPILSKHDMGPLTVNLDPKSHPVVGSPPNLREFGIHDSSDGQFTDVGTGLGASVNSTEMVNGADLGLSYLTLILVVLPTNVCLKT